MGVQEWVGITEDLDVDPTELGSQLQAGDLDSAR